MLIGKRVGERYEIKSHIGGGGMSHVYLAHDIILGRDVAIKVLRYDFTNEDELHRRFQREAMSATSLTHPHIVSVYDVGDDGDMHYIVMEYVKGKTLKQYIQEFSPTSPAKSVQIMKQLTSAIANAHEMGIIHRDIKPQNVLMDEDGTVKVTDFGIAITMNATSYTQTNSVMGTVHYLSPEQARGGIATKKSDIYALGIVLYELLTGELPFLGESAVSIALKHLQSETPSVREFDASIPQALENIVLKATAKDPNHRYETVEELEEDLQTCLAASRLHEPKFAPPIDNEATKAIPIIRDQTPVAEELVETRKIETVTIPPKQQPAPVAPSTPPVQEVSKKPKKKKWPLMLAALFTLLVIGFIVMILLTPNKVVVPDVAMQSVEDATTILEEAGFVLGEVTERYDESVAKDLVIGSQPKAGIERVKGSEIDLVVSLGTETQSVANYVGSSISQVEPVVNQLGFKDVDISYVYDDRPENEVLKQEPAAGTDVIIGETVLTLTVSQGIEMVKVSDLTGFTEAAIKEYARASGLTVQQGTAVNSETVPAGNVVSQKPVGGTSVAKGGKVTVFLSKGPVEKRVKNYFNTIDIPYTGELDEEGNPIPQIVHVYIQDKNNTMAEAFEELTIIENTKYNIEMQIVEGDKAAYRIMIDDTLFDQQTIPYE